jgi:hypothetical protein
MHRTHLQVHNISTQAMLNLFKQVKSQGITVWGQCCKIKLVMIRVGSSEVRECVRCMLTGGLPHRGIGKTTSIRGRDISASSYVRFLGVRRESLHELVKHVRVEEACAIILVRFLNGCKTVFHALKLGYHAMLSNYTKNVLLVQRRNKEKKNKKIVVAGTLR